MSVHFTTPSVDQLTAAYGPLRTIQHFATTPRGLITRWKRVDIDEQHRQVYGLALWGGRLLRQSIVKGRPLTALTISVIEYTDPVGGHARYAVEHWSLKGKRVVDHAVRAIADAEYERQVRAELVDPTLPTFPVRIAGGLATFYDATDVI
ncbi:hypothetical protein [Streptomyces sp. NPDC050485]|uniref:hypothetical protein n=1 Tax=Streptomyces sp. NPDC050485 TaxID=3365617 RepID=UPI0037B745E3